MNHSNVSKTTFFHSLINPSKSEASASSIPTVARAVSLEFFWYIQRKQCHHSLLKHPKQIL
jgi:hypothetical protein